MILDFHSFEQLKKMDGTLYLQKSGNRNMIVAKIKM